MFRSDSLKRCANNETSFVTRGSMQSRRFFSASLHHPSPYRVLEASPLFLSNLFANSFQDPAISVQLDVLATRKESEEQQLSNAKQSRCTLNQTFNVLEWQEAAPLLHDFVAEASKELECKHFGWSLNEHGLHWRAVYSHGLAAADHFHKMKPLVDCLTAGPAELLSSRVHGPSAEMSKMKKNPVELDVEFCEENGSERILSTSSTTKGQRKTGAEGAFRFEVENDGGW